MVKHVKSTPLCWIEALDRSAAEVAAGQTVPIEPVLDELRASAERLEARLAATPSRKKSAGKIG